MAKDLESSYQRQRWDTLETVAAGDPAVVCAVICHWFANGRPKVSKVDIYDVLAVLNEYGSIILEITVAGRCGTADVAYVDTGVMPSASRMLHS